MRKYRFFVENKLVDLDKGIIVPDNTLFRYVENVLRGGDDCQLIAFDGSGKEYIVTYDMPKKVLRIRDIIANCVNKGFSLTLFQAIPKGNYMDDVTALCSQLGVDEIVPVITSRTTVKQVSDAKLNRWRRIAMESCKVGGYCNTTNIDPAMTIDNAYNKIPTFDLSLFLYENAEDKRLSDYDTEIRTSERICLVIGPEGGFDEQEATKLSSICKTVSLGPVIYRSRWVGAIGITCINYIKGIVG
ncbi:RsmE family RNA methyltransferase [Coprothermobacter platensis]|uniref:RsmE family RNA methyltransferase n=1 Tax=Coprothermobacter platensis TaxID=108819 RepID=UPI00037BB10B|nr:RsmE family RNA methyltransferase [Coprothermobacter platensis]